MKTLDMKQSIRVYIYIVIGLLGLLCLRLMVVQLFNNSVYQTQAKDNSIRLLAIKAPRGEIFGRNDEKLAANKLVYTVSLSVMEKADNRVVVNNLVNMMHDYYPDITGDAINEKINQQKFRLYEPVLIMRDIPWELVVKMEENRRSLPGVNINVEPLRYYPQGSLAGHVLGYIRAISQDELDSAEGSKYSINSLIGKSGIEKQYENYLKGNDGARRVEVDSQGRPIQELVTLQPQAGNNLYLTIDPNLQLVLENSMNQTLAMLQGSYPKARVGSAVVLNVRTGEVLAMCSNPALDPNDWIGNISSDQAAYYFPQGTQYNPLQPGAATNRAIQATYPPGSTFKPITGMSALENGGMDPLNDLVDCTGAYWLPPYIKCTGVHGNVNYYNAMAVSCNVYFQEMGRRAGKDELISVGKQFGLGAKTGIDLPFESQGLLPTPEWKKSVNGPLLDRRLQANLKQVGDKYKVLLDAAKDPTEIADLQKKEKAEEARLEAQYKIDYAFDTQWQPYDTYNMAIGQGGNNYTVMQLANYIAAVANGGALMKPYLVSKITSPQGQILQQFKSVKERQVNVSSRNIAETRRAMQQVTQPGGTAYSLFANFPDNIKVAAKTGTAQTGRTGDDPHSEYHGVFIAFAPFDNPEIAFAGVVEYGYSGSGSAGLACKAVFEQYFGVVDHLAGLKLSSPANVNSPHTSVPANPE